MKPSMEYIAGYFDGEGCVGLYQNKGSKCSRYKSGFKSPSWIRQIGITNTYKPILEHCKRLFGGRLYPQSKIGRNKPCYNWTISSKKDIIAFIERVSPFLVEKQPQTALLLQECRGYLSANDVASTIKALKRSST